MVNDLFNTRFPNKRMLMRELIVHAAKGTKSSDINHFAMLFFEESPDPAETVKLAAFIKKAYPEYYEGNAPAIELASKAIQEAEGIERKTRLARTLITLLKERCLDIGMLTPQ